MSDRLNELLRQKQLLQEHINWLDREIARTATDAAGAAPATLTPPPVAPVAPPRIAAGEPDFNAPAATTAPAVVHNGPTPGGSAVPSGKTEEAMRMADEIIARYQQEEAIRPEDTKRGCLVLAGALFVILAAIFLVTYVIFYRNHQ